MNDKIIQACGEDIQHFMKSMYFTENVSQNNYARYNYLTWETILKRVLNNSSFKDVTQGNLFNISSKIMHFCKISRPRNIHPLTILPETFHAVEFDISKMRIAIYVTYYSLCTAFGIDPFNITLPSYYTTLANKLKKIHTSNYNHILLSKQIIAYTKLALLDKSIIFPSNTQFYISPFSKDSTNTTFAKVLTNFLSFDTKKDMIAFYLSFMITSINVNYLLNNESENTKFDVYSCDDFSSLNIYDTNNDNIQTILSSSETLPIIGCAYKNESSIYITIYNEDFIIPKKCGITVAYSYLTGNIMSSQNNIGIGVEKDTWMKFLQVLPQWSKNSWCNDNILQKLIKKLEYVFS